MLSVVTQQGGQGMRIGIVMYAKVPVTTLRNGGHSAAAAVLILMLIVLQGINIKQGRIRRAWYNM